MSSGPLGFVEAGLGKDAEGACLFFFDTGNNVFGSSFVHMFWGQYLPFAITPNGQCLVQKMDWRSATGPFLLKFRSIRNCWSLPETGETWTNSWERRSWPASPQEFFCIDTNKCTMVNVCAGSIHIVLQLMHVPLWARNTVVMDNVQAPDFRQQERAGISMRYIVFHTIGMRFLW